MEAMTSVLNWSCHRRCWLRSLLWLIATGALAASLMATPLPASAQSVVTAPSDITETTSGTVGFAVIGTGLDPRRHITIDTHALNAVCKALSVYPVGEEVETDFDGRFNAAVAASGCASGSYPLVAVESSSPNRQFVSSVRINPPVTFGPGLVTSPASEVETGRADSPDADGEVAFALIARGLNSNEPVFLDFTPLAKACHNGVHFGAVKNTDYTGAFVTAVVAAGCNSGTFNITVTEPTDGHRSFSTQITVIAPQP
jgi:ABC-type amino acid transport substrate-binding protein